ncbi:hypothetical protein FBQ97_08880 [Acidobacteria bacterium ACD]|nr:MAG: serine/threonine protein kinase [Acidobacteriota bacterium]MCE7958473.1 serine/threonine protein kinase [Acidobacteria bacterium ACB2]MDL1949910.1 hypothetical protein [Acidobacteria bacterium ACD]
MSNEMLIGRYRVVGKLGEGGMGIVYSAVHRDRPSERVAVKVVRSDVSETAESLRRFRREAAILEELSHENIVRLLEVGVQGEQRYFVMEYLDARPMSDYAGYPWESTLPLLAQVVEGLDYLARRSIVHRDLSCSNLLVTQGPDGGIVKIVDFGISKDLEAVGSIHGFTQTGLMMGKPAYWSPEQLGFLPKGERVDWRADLYAFGVVCYFVLTGRHPITADSPYSYASAHLTTEPSRMEPPEGCPVLPAPVVELVHRMLAKRREDRPASWEEVRRVFRNALAETAEPTAVTAGMPEFTAPTVIRPHLPVVTEAPRSDAVPPASGAPLPAAEVRVRRHRSRLVVPAALAAVFVAGLLVGIRLLTPRPESRTSGVAGPATGVPIPRTTTVPVTAPRGHLALDSVPWARVLLLRAEDAEAPVPLPADAATPFRIDLPEGSYVVEIADGISMRRRTLRLGIRAGETTERLETFEDGEAVLGYFDSDVRRAR